MAAPFTRLVVSILWFALQAYPNNLKYCVKSEVYISLSEITQTVKS
ncbi:hypothetical protein MADA3029_290013 [Vibrio nigripulchritudo MADA3029]|nr:hypothetical protein VIBNIMADA3020_450013 [Vibrio nigripulchritudo MADA3020]CCN56080.1 hypothetical protein VIBNIMADA3021_870002 [Vibrio nigripulchritudo MADA3021]CCN58884.1 hypothetical protein MADA3029_290013 [Vibrio nigripulchritudo MADA3029]